MLLGARTYFSLGESILDPKVLVEGVQQAGYTAVALSDTNTINAVPVLAGPLKAAGIELIIGASLKVVDDLSWRKGKKGEPKTRNPFWYAGVYAINSEGFHDLMDALTLAHSEGNFYQKPQIDNHQLLELYQKGNVVVTTGSLFSLFMHHDADTHLRALLAHDRERLYCELLAVETPYADAVNRRALDYALQHGLPLLMARPTLHQKDEAETRDLMGAILENASIDAPFLNKVPPVYSLAPKSEVMDALRGCLARISDRLSSPIDIDQVLNGVSDGMTRFKGQCGYRWERFDICLPKMADDPFLELVSLCKKGWSERMLTPVLGYQPPAAELPRYTERLKYELGIIKRMGFSDYFLMVRDVVQWCKSNGIAVGPGRGSVGGSLIAFLLGITEVDPIRFGLFFERFINPERLDLPDIDLDFMSSRRTEVVEYLIDKYGAERVAGISNYGMLGSASALRGVAKAHGLRESDYACSKLMPKEHGQPVELESALGMVPEIEAFAIAHPKIWRQACKLQGVFRVYGQHAAGVIVAGEPIHRRAVLESREGGQVVNWDMRAVESFGLVKLDILGLQTLDVLALTLQYIRERRGIEVNLTQIPLDDRDVLKAFGEGRTTGVFQFESGGMKNLLRQLADDAELTFEDVAAATALYRPGPMESGLMNDFVQIKQGNREPFYLHPNLEPALRETYSVIVYQEQVMQVARDLAGFTMAESDRLRKAMGKKLPEEMKKFRDKFVSGAQATSGLTAEVAERLFDQIEQFAGYAFNKSHSVEYTVISYWAMWLKVHYAPEFLAAALTIMNEDKRKGLVKEAEQMGMVIMPPDINRSSDRFEIVEEGGDIYLYAPFQSILGLSEKASAAILEAKAKVGRDFTSKAEFVACVNRRHCNIRGQEALDKVGAFARIEPGQLPPRHPDRLKDQKQLLPGLISTSVMADRKIEISPYVTAELGKVLTTCQGCGKCSLAGTPHPIPRMGRSAKIMVILDSPSWSECEAGKYGEGDGAAALRAALKSAGLSWRDVYLTALVKAQKPKGEQLTNEMIIGCSEYLQEEIRLLKPPVIVTLGGKVSRMLLPDLRGSWDEILGQEVYDAKLDATIVVGMNPGMVFMDGSKQRLLNQVLKQAADLIA